MMHRSLTVTGGNMEDATATEATRLGRETRGGPGNPLSRYYAVFRRGQTYLNLAYLWLGFGLGIAYFVGLATVISVAGGLSITLVGIPLLIAAMFAWCAVAEWERIFTNVMLGTAIEPLPFRDEPGAYWQWRRISARLGNHMTWRGLLLLFLRFPVSLAAFVLSTALLFIPLAMIAMPFLALSDGGVDFFYWRVDTFWQGLLFVLPGVLLLPAALYGFNFVATMSGALTGAILGPAASPARPGAAVDRAAAAAVSWRGLSLRHTISEDTAYRQSLQVRVYGIHLAIFAVASLILVTINGLSTPGVWWSIWPIWVLGMFLGAHTGYLLRGIFGLHAGLFVVVNLGLFVIDATYSGLNWFFYPLLAWGALLILHGYGAKAIMAAAADRAYLRPSGEGSPEGPALTPSAEGNDAGPTTTYEPRPAPAITVDVMMRVVTVGGRQVDLTPKEFDLLALFAQNPGRPFSRDDLLDRIWKNDYEVTDRTIDTHVQRLRKKLGDQSDAIQTVWGVGYRFQAL